jgi:predicted glycosyltransferase
MIEHDGHVRVLMYSHDTFGLGHLRRTRAIAHALVEQHKKLSVLIISGSSIAGAYDFKARVDFIKIPSVIKLRNGDYTSLSDHIDLSETLSMRRAIIESAAINFRPNIFIADKEPRGLRGELDPTLPRLRAMNCEVILGLREVLDEPAVVRDEWARTDALHWLDDCYDRIWVYGSRDFYDPLAAIPMPVELRERIDYVGFLARTVPEHSVPREQDLPTDFILVTAGGGGDAAHLMAQTLAAKASDPTNRRPFVLVLGPYMSLAEKTSIRQLAANLDDVYILDFDNRLEELMARATAVIAMGGYNTFCELMSFDKRALIVPRTTPRKEQLIRARRAEEFGLLAMLDPVDADDPHRMAAAIRDLARRPKPSEVAYQIDLSGLDRIGAIVDEIRHRKVAARLTGAHGR